MPASLSPRFNTCTNAPQGSPSHASTTTTLLGSTHPSHPCCQCPHPPPALPHPSPSAVTSKTATTTPCVGVPSSVTWYLLPSPPVLSPGPAATAIAAGRGGREYGGNARGLAPLTAQHPWVTRHGYDPPPNPRLPGRYPHPWPTMTGPGPPPLTVSWSWLRLSLLLLLPPALQKSFRDAVPDHLHDFEDVFSKATFDELPEHKQWDHAIELEPGSTPSLCKVYPLAPSEQAELDAFLDENLKSGRIRPSKSPMASPVFFIKKKDGLLRLVQDYRALNAITVKNRYPLPLISELINNLRGARYFMKLDVQWGYNNVRIKEGNEWKAMFRTNRGLFEPLVMFFGLTNSPATFQTMMNDIFHDLIAQGVVCVYLDDILIYTKTLEEQPVHHPHRLGPPLRTPPVPEAREV
ncbi:putative reverse transcriptase-rnase h-integrase [Lyophyllum shimeji]|uniref:Reverse transcriptase-rnase h-integrase n=1 Tax=Lyophyllum shimeji TaxID=47721 RepID=A0A9P3UQE7_LYOSH|nr:putative reverse transcriptase-rnase h-integrase [Lyophyllum shimeji]